MNEATLGDGSKVKVCDIVYFKYDVEQYGMVAKIEPTSRGAMLTLTNKRGFAGEYIGRMNAITIFANECRSK